MTDRNLRAAAHADLKQRLGGETFVPLLSVDRTEPLGLPDWLRKTGLDELTAFEPGS